jgi:hypothetical protein
MKYLKSSGEYFVAFLIYVAATPRAVEAAFKFVTCSGTTCSACNFVEMGNAIIVWMIGMMFVIFAVMMVSAGFGLITSGGNTQAVSDAKSKFTNALIGLLIVLGGWLLVDTIMRGLLKGGTGDIEGYGPWSEVKCGYQSTTQVVAYDTSLDNETAGSNTAVGSGGAPSTPPPVAGPAGSLSDAGVNVADWYGTNGPGRTGNANANVIAATKSMQDAGQAANGGKIPFQVTAATTEGVGHSAGSQHYAGTAVDVQPINGASYDQLIQLCKNAGFTFVNDERAQNHIHCDMR